MFTVLDPLLEFTYHLLFSWRKFALCIQSLLCMLFLFGWPPCQRSDMILMEVSQHAYDMIHYISGLFGYFNVCEIYVNWYGTCIYLCWINFVWVWVLVWISRFMFSNDSWCVNVVYCRGMFYWFIGFVYVLYVARVLLYFSTKMYFIQKNLFILGTWYCHIL